MSWVAQIKRLRSTSLEYTEHTQWLSIARLIIIRGYRIYWYCWYFRLFFFFFHFNFHLTNLVNINAIIKRWMKTLLVKQQTICCTIILLPQYVLTIYIILPNFTTRMKAFQKTPRNSFFPSHKTIGCLQETWNIAHKTYGLLWYIYRYMDNSSMTILQNISSIDLVWKAGSMFSNTFRQNIEHNPGRALSLQ